MRFFGEISPERGARASTSSQRLSSHMSWYAIEAESSTTESPTGISDEKRMAPSGEFGDVGDCGDVGDADVAQVADAAGLVGVGGVEVVTLAEVAARGTGGASSCASPLSVACSMA